MKPSGPISFHHSRNPGCHCSSARCRRLSEERLTLFGIFSFSDTLLIVILSRVASKVASGPAPIEIRPLAGLAVDRERAFLARRVRASEDPVLPGGEAAEDLGLERFRSDEAQ